MSYNPAPSLTQVFRGLHLRTGEAGDAATTVTMLHADEILCSNGARRTPADNLSAVISTAGIGGLRASQAEAASTWYKVMYAYGASGEGLYLEQAKDYFLDESYAASDDSSVALRYGATSSELAQGFQVDTSGPIPFVDIKVQKTLAPTGNLWAEIHSDSGGTPVDGPLAISAYVSMANVSTSAQWIRFVFRTPYVVTAGTQYHLILQGSNVADATNYINIRMDNTSPAYARGILQRRHNGTWDDMSADALFCVYVTRNDNAVAPPAGYDTGYAQIGWVYNNGSSNFRAFRQQDKETFTYGNYDTGTLTATIHTLTDLSSALPPVPVRVSQYTTLSTVAGSRLWILGDYSLVGSYDADVYAQAANYWLAQAAPVLVEYQAVYLKVSANDQRFSFDGYRW